MISLAAITFDLSGYITLDPIGVDYGTIARRSNKTPTLDGGVSSSDYGFTHGDREFTVSFKPTLAEDTTLRYIVETHAQISVSVNEGVFQAIPEYTVNEGVGLLSLSITEQLA
jgi:hypothetical protein